MKSRFEYSVVLLFVLLKVKSTISISLSNMFFMDTTGEDIADYISVKKYIPNEKELMKMPLIKNTDNDATYILSKLSDVELIKLLNEQPLNNEFNLNDIVKIGFDTREKKANRLQSQGDITGVNSPSDAISQNKRDRTISNNAGKESPYFKLNHNPVDKNKGQNAAHYLGFQKLRNLLNEYKQSNAGTNYFDNDNEGKKELLFDILVTQLKSLCCKKSKTSVSNNEEYKTIVNDILPSLLKNGMSIPNLYNPKDMRLNEYMFLIINDEIKSSGNDELISVVPESLDGNSSVLLLGPVTTPLSDDQLKLVMNKISNELAKPDYLFLLQQISKGDLNNYNKNIVNNFVFGRETRRYIKPHRCNYQSKLAKVYGGPRWIICTGYLNLNKPSLYD